MFAKILFTGLSILFLLACDTTPAAPLSLEQRQSAADSLDTRIIQSANDFGLKMHRQLIQQSEGKNVFLSPLSLSLALAMTFNGSAEETRAEMASAMGWDGMNAEEVNVAIQALSRLLEQPGKGVQFNIANSLWTRKGKKFHADFLKTNRDFYNAEIAELDFTDPKSVERINQWVKKQTRDKIPKIVEYPVSDNLVMFLINAVYFKGGWTKEFSEKATRQDRFTLLDGTSKQVMIMSQNGSFEYLQQPEFQAIRLPYGEGQMSMLVVVPNETSTLETLHEKIWSEPEMFQKTFAKNRGLIELPRFKIEYEGTMNSALKAVGMQLAFDPGKADFSAMADTPPNLYISEVKHKTYLEVNERGSEAAAVTSIGVEATSAPVDQFRMLVNRPFFVAIEDRQTGAWLFIGSVTDPE